MNSDCSPTLLITALACLAVTACSTFSQRQSTLPPLLLRAGSGGGWNSACPPRNDQERNLIEQVGIGVSPELDHRLREEFPAGSSSGRLISSLTAQGFLLVGPCETDLSIQQAQFFQKGVGTLPYDVHALVYWKSDEQGRIVWTAGFVSYRGL